MGELGLTGEWANKPIVLYGRNEGSGTYKYFQEHALYKGTFKPNYKTAPGSSGVIDAITMINLRSVTAGLVITIPMSKSCQSVWVKMLTIRLSLR